MSDPDAPALSVRAIIEILDVHEVDYVVIGGVAGAVHGSAHVTRDFDITPQWRADNLDRLASALISMDARLRAEGNTPGSRTIVEIPISGQDLAAFEVSTWRTRFGDLDIVSGTPTLTGDLADYDQLARKAANVEAYGITISVAALDDIIEAKRALRREPDLAALPELYRLRDTDLRVSHPDEP